MNNQLKKNIQLLPHTPGVYIFYNKEGEVIYVGKAKDLRNRVSSYYSKEIMLYPKTYKMIEQAYTIKIIVVQSELEAFLLEEKLIKKHKPKYNIQLKDDKSYKYIIIDKIKLDTKDDTKSRFLWRIYSGRINKLKKTQKRQNIVYTFGPFADSKTINYILRMIRTIIPYANCSYTKFKKYAGTYKQTCLYGALGLCPGPCTNMAALETNRKNILKIKKIIKDGYSKFLDEQLKKMKKYSDNLEFEKALQIRDFIKHLRKIENISIIPNQYLDNPNLIEEIRQQRLKDIKYILKLDKLKRIECYDISNIMGKWATGSMVVSIDGELAKKEYKKFKIKYVRQISDFDMMYEVLYRRLKHSDWGLPDLLLIDGGRGQVSKVLKVLKRLNLNIMVVGIFKPNDYLIFKRDDTWHIIRNFRDYKLGWQHLRTLRDEAHRFAKKYHKQIRIKDYRDNKLKS